MKLSCQKQALTDCLSRVMRAVSSKASAIAALEGVLLEASGNQLKLTGYNLDMGITTTMFAACEEDGAVVLNASLLFDLVKRLPEDQLSLSVDEKFTALIVSGESEFSIVGIDAVEYPELPAVTEETEIELEASMLKGMAEQILFAVAVNDDARPINTGVLFSIEEHFIRMAAVDGYRLAIREESVFCDQRLRFVVPGKTLSEITKMIDQEKEKETIRISVGRRKILFVYGGMTVISSLLEGEFIDYEAAIPKTAVTTVRVGTRTLIDMIERISPLITDRLKTPVRCIFEDNQIRASCTTAVGKGHDQCSCVSEGERIEIGFNNRYLLDALRASETDEVKIELAGSLSPIKILPLEGNSFLFLVLPVRLKHEG